MVKSLYQFEYKKAYIGNLSITYAFVLHLIILMINIFFHSQFSSLSLPFAFTYFDFVILNLVYLVYECAVAWICYSYTKNLGDGNDALVDGMNFDRYIENFGSEIGSNNGDFNSSEPNKKSGEKKNESDFSDNSFRKSSEMF